MRTEKTKEYVKVLQFTIGGTDFTGIANFLHQYYSKINRSLVHFDFVFAKENSMKLVSGDPIYNESKFMELKATNKRNSVDYIVLWRRLDDVIKNGRYDVFHINTFRLGIALLCILVARKNGIKTVVSHSHNSQFVARSNRPVNFIKKILKNFVSTIIRNNVDYMFACSINAGIALFGEKGVKRKNFHVISNAIDSEKFVFQESMRVKTRLEQNVDDTAFVIGQVGRLAYPKNQQFSVDVLANIIKIVPTAELWLIGTGVDMELIKIHADKLHILDKIKFLGERNDIPELMMGMDLLLFPSIFEGLGIVAIEAQATGLPVFASTAVTKETEITDLIHYLPLESGSEKWAEEIINTKNYSRTNQQRRVIESGYDINVAVKLLEKFYINV